MVRAVRRATSVEDSPVSTFTDQTDREPRNGGGYGNGNNGQALAGLTPPHSIEAEQAVLGAVLLSDKTMYSYIVADNLQPEDFYRERHRLIFQSMLALWQDSEPIDDVTLSEHLKGRGRLDDAGGRAAIDELLAAPPAVGAIRQYAKIVKDNALLRAVLATTYEIQAAVHGHEHEPREIVEQAERQILEVAHDDRTKDFRVVGNVLEDELKRWEKISREGIQMTGTPSGFRELDEITGGFQPGNLIILAARPSMGKSALVTNIAENVALHPSNPRAVALFSLEMSESELAQRFVASQSSIKGDDLRRGRLRDERKWRKVLDTAQRFHSAPLHIDDSSDISMLEIRAKARRLHQQADGGLGMIIVDYLQLLRPDGRTDNRVEQVGQMSRGLKILARELECPVIALSQLSRGVEQRNDKRPLLSDLRESGNIEQDADLVMFIYRDEYYNKETSDAIGEAELLIAKHRNGSLGTVEVMFQGEYPRFLNKAREQYA
jgi:replicative DNA helicase